jgi:Bacterial PH domain
MSHDDFEFEPIRGLPALLPEGERLLWQGAPGWKSLAVRAYHVRKVAAYFAVLVAWRVGVGLYNGHAVADVVVSCAFLFTLGGIAIGVLSLLAYLNARSTVYSITSRRVLLRHGIAVPLTMNIPFKLIDDAALKTFKDDSGDIALRLSPTERIGYLITWPHLRPGKITRPQPSLRAVDRPREVADLLGAALAADAGIEAVRVAPRVRSAEVHTGAGREAAVREAAGRETTAREAVA